MELLEIINEVIGNVFDKIARILSHIWGWIASIVAFILTWLISWFGETREACVYLVLAAVLIDLTWGIASSYKRGTFAMSIGFTKTCIKLAVYLSILTIVAITEKALADDWNLIFRLTASVLIVAEAVSISGHILIIKPDTPVVKILWKVLKSEIAKKLGIDVKDIEDFIIQHENNSENIITKNKENGDTETN